MRTKLTPEERFWSKVEKTETCWLWTGSRTSGGYGNFWSGKTMMYAHRWAYENAVGPIPEGLQLDHLCRTRHCVLPSHLEPVTQAENIRRGEAGMVGAEMMRSKTHCPQGHPYDAPNTYHYRGKRGCVMCRAASTRAYQARKRGTHVSEAPAF